MGSLVQFKPTCKSFVSVVAREASRLQWLDTIVTPVTLKHMPGRRAVSATKPILTQVS